MASDRTRGLSGPHPARPRDGGHRDRARTRRVDVRDQGRDEHDQGLRSDPGERGAVAGARPGLVVSGKAVKQIAPAPARPRDPVRARAPRGVRPADSHPSESPVRRVRRLAPPTACATAATRMWADRRSGATRTRSRASGRSSRSSRASTRSATTNGMSSRRPRSSRHSRRYAARSWGAGASGSTIRSRRRRPKNDATHKCSRASREDETE